MTRNIWNKWAKYLLDKRLLARTDGPALLALVEAELIGDRERMEAIAATWRDREPFPESQEPTAPEEMLTGATLADFLAAVQRERFTYPARIVPVQTVCLDSNDQPYAWPEGDAAEVARRYALEVTQGSLVAGELMQARLRPVPLADLEDGHARGIFFDPVAARGIGGDVR